MPAVEGLHNRRSASKYSVIPALAAEPAPGPNGGISAGISSHDYAQRGENAAASAAVTGCFLVLHTNVNRP